MDLAKRSSESTRPLARFRDEMDHLFHRFFGDGDRGWPGLASMRGAWWPALDLTEKDDQVVVRAEMPGIKPEDVSVSVHDTVLTISGEKKQETEENGDGYYHSERQYGAFRRDIQLPAGVDADKVKATCRDGVLTVTLPKTEQSKPRRVEIKT